MTDRTISRVVMLAGFIAVTTGCMLLGPSPRLGWWVGMVGLW